jgi:hypothetical protein
MILAYPPQNLPYSFAEVATCSKKVYNLYNDAIDREGVKTQGGL